MNRTSVLYTTITVGVSLVGLFSLIYFSASPQTPDIAPPQVKEWSVQDGFPQVEIGNPELIQTSPMYKLTHDGVEVLKQPTK